MVCFWFFLTGGQALKLSYPEEQCLLFFGPEWSGSIPGTTEYPLFGGEATTSMGNSKKAQQSAKQKAQDAIDAFRTDKAANKKAYLDKKKAEATKEADEEEEEDHVAHDESQPLTSTAAQHRRRPPVLKHVLSPLYLIPRSKKMRMPMCRSSAQICLKFQSSIWTVQPLVIVRICSLCLCFL